MRGDILRAVALAVCPVLLAVSPPTLQGARVGFYAVDLANGTTLVDQDSTGDFIPASTMKLLVGSAALDLLPSDFTFSTRVAIEGSHLYVQGGGDPTLDDRALDDAAATLATLGIHHIDVLSLDSSRYSSPWYPPGWSIDDLPYDYNAPVTALSLDENVMHVVVTPGAQVGDPARILRPNDANLDLSSNGIVTGARGESDTSDLQRDALAPALHAVGSIPLGGGDVTLDAAMQDPMRVIATRMLVTLKQHRVETSLATQDEQVTPPSAREVWRRTSAGLSQLLPQCWLPSDNLYGEVLLNEIGVRSARAGSTLDDGIDAERTWLRSFGIDPVAFTIADGSGLSSYDRVTPRGLVAVLVHDWTGPHKSAVLDALPVAGVRGTLQHRFAGTPLQGVLYAKTGSMNHTRTLAGYLIAPGHTIAFALMINDWMDDAPNASASVEAIQGAMLEGLLVSSPADASSRH